MKKLMRELRLGEIYRMTRMTTIGFFFGYFGYKAHMRLSYLDLKVPYQQVSAFDWNRSPLECTLPDHRGALHSHTHTDTLDPNSLRYDGNSSRQAKSKALICNLALPQLSVAYRPYTQLDLHCIFPSHLRPPMSADSNCTRLHHLALAAAMLAQSHVLQPLAALVASRRIILCCPVQIYFLSLSLQLSPSCTSARSRQ